MEYGDKRDYAKIDIFLKRPGGMLTYLCSTTWAKTCKEAKERFAFKKEGYAASDLIARYAKKRA